MTARLIPGLKQLLQTHANERMVVGNQDAHIIFVSMITLPSLRGRTWRFRLLTVKAAGFSALSAFFFGKVVAINGQFDVEHRELLAHVIVDLAREHLIARHR